jgi:predicted ATPase
VLGEVLISSRQAMGLTQEGLSERSGVSVRTIRNLEAGVIRSPRESTTELLLEALGGGAVDGRDSGADRLVGRDGDLEHVGWAVRQWRMVVLTGPAGVGKSRLAVEVADRAGSAFGSGVVVVQAGVLERDRAGAAGDRVRAVIADAVTGRLGERRMAVAGGGDRLAGDVLVVLDTAEHVLGSAAVAVRSVLEEWPGVHVLVTSRRPMPAALARHWEVRPLAVTRGAGVPGPGPAVELFLARAEASCPTLDLRREIEAVTRLCRRLDGLPFALELAAARVRSVPIGTLLAEPAWRVLGSAEPGGLAHQASLAASIGWSYDLLTGPEQAVLHELARFGREFTFQDARALAAAGDVPVADILAALVDSSLLQVTRGSTYRYRLANTTREYLDTKPPVGGPGGQKLRARCEGQCKSRW